MPSAGGAAPRQPGNGYSSLAARFIPWSTRSGWLGRRGSHLEPGGFAGSDGRVRVNRLGMEPLLPHLKLTAVLMSRVRLGQQVQEPAPLFRLDLRQQAIVEAQPLLLAAELQRPNEDVTAGRQREQRQPVHNGGSHEMRAFGLANGVAASHAATLSVGKRSFKRRGVPKALR